MAAYNLTYFDMDGGGAEHIRIALHAGGRPSEDHRIAFPEIAEMRRQTHGLLTGRPIASAVCDEAIDPAQRRITRHASSFEHIMSGAHAGVSPAWGRFQTGLRGVLLTLTIPAEPRIFLGKLFCAP